MSSRRKKAEEKSSFYAMDMEEDLRVQGEELISTLDGMIGAQQELGATHLDHYLDPRIFQPAPPPEVQTYLVVLANVLEHLRKKYEVEILRTENGADTLRIKWAAPLPPELVTKARDFINTFRKL